MTPHTTTDHSDIELFERIRSRDQSALSDLYDRHSRLLYSIIAAIVRDTDEAENILQEVFVCIWTTADTCREELGSPKTWMVRLAHNHAIAWIRAHRLRHPEPLAPVAVVENADSDSTEETPQPALATIGLGLIGDYPIAVLSALPVEERVVIDLAFLQGYTHSEIAEITGIPPGSVRTTIRSGMLTLRSSLGVATFDTDVRQKP